jgi:hypothetical protein
VTIRKLAPDFSATAYFKGFKKVFLGERLIKLKRSVLINTEANM